MEWDNAARRRKPIDERLVQTYLRGARLRGEQLESLPHHMRQVCKRSKLPRITAAIGIVKAMQPANILDIGLGRGSFLWELIDEIKCDIVAVDKDMGKVSDFDAFATAGMPFSVLFADAMKLPFEDGQFDMVTMLEVLEHLPEPQKGLSEALRVSKRAVVLSVPSKLDDNPQHLHFLDRDALKKLLSRCSAKGNFSYVHGHCLVVARRASDGKAEERQGQSVQAP